MTQPITPVIITSESLCYKLGAMFKVSECMSVSVFLCQIVINSCENDCCLMRVF